MAISHNVTLRNTFATALVDDLDGGSDVGNMVLLTGSTVVSTIPLNKPSFGAPAAGIITIVTTPALEDPSAVGNVAAVDSFQLQDSDSTQVITGGVGTVGSGSDLELSKNPIASGDIVQLTSFSYQATA